MEYSRPGGAVVFDFRMGREGEGLKRFLGNFEGVLQSDGYAAYDHVGGHKIVHAACGQILGASYSRWWDSIQRTGAIGIVAQIDQLFETDAQAR